MYIQWNSTQVQGDENEIRFPFKKERIIDIYYNSIEFHS